MICKKCKHLNKMFCPVKGLDLNNYGTKDFVGFSCDSFDEISFDPVGKPSHYANAQIECIDAMEAAFGKDTVMAFCRGNAFKYLWRGGKKKSADKSGDEKCIEDLKKAIWYINKEIELINR